MASCRFPKLFLCAAVAATLAIPSAPSASILDSVFFRVLGLVIVWGADSTGTSAPVAQDFVLMTTGSGNPGADLIAGDTRTLVTGTLIPVTAPAATEGTIMAVTNPTSGGVFTDTNSNGYLDAADTMTAFGIDATTDVTNAGNAVDHSFFVASNAVFDVIATVGPLTTTGNFTTFTDADIGWGMNVTSSGTSGALAFGSQATAAAALGTVGAQTTLADVGATPTVFTGAARTAAGVGTLVDQSVRFEPNYAITSYDMSQGTGTVSVDVTYTIYVP